MQSLETNETGAWIKNALLATLVVNSATMLSLGIRTYTIITIASLAARKLYREQSIENLRRRWKSINLFKVSKRSLAYTLVVPFSLFCLVYIGIQRMGIIPSVKDIMPYLAAESVLNSISVGGANLKCLGEVSFYIGIPSDIVSGIINLVPTVLLPDKSALIPTQSSCISSNLGGTQITASLLANFGVIGSSIAVFTFGCWLKFAEKSAGHSCLWLYSYVSGCCLSIVFRDPLSISVKVMALYPIAFALIAKLFINIGKRNRSPIE
jgi:hypothetical protein